VESLLRDKSARCDALERERAQSLAETNRLRLQLDQVGSDSSLDRSFVAAISNCFFLKKPITKRGHSHRWYWHQLKGPSGSTYVRLRNEVFIFLFCIPVEDPENADPYWSAPH